MDTLLPTRMIPYDDNFDSFLTYEIADGWTALDGVENVYYRVVDTTTEAVTFSVLKDDQVTVKSDVTKEKMNELKNGSSLQPTLTVTAYASQFNKSADESFTVQEAWNNIPPSSTN